MRSKPYTKCEIRARVRETRLRELGYEDYPAYLRSMAWRDLKERYRASDLPQICMCGDTQVQLHHTTYDRVGRERLDDLIPLCDACHIHAHLLEAAGVITLDLDGFYYDAQRAAKNAVLENVRKAQASADFNDPALKVPDAYSRRLERRRQRGRNMRRHTAMMAAADPETVARRRARIFAEAAAREAKVAERRRQVEENREAGPRMDYRPSAIPMS